LKEEPLHVSFNYLFRRIQNGFSRIKNDPPAPVEFRKTMPDGFAHAASHSVARDGFTHGAGNCESDSGSIFIGDGQAKGGKVLAREAKSPIINFAEIGGAQDTAVLRKSEARAFVG
jgi:hypothetical protein